MKLSLFSQTFWYDGITLKNLKFAVLKKKKNMLQVIVQHLLIEFYEWKWKIHHNYKFRCLYTLTSTWLPLVSPTVACWDVILSISRVHKSPTFRSPLLGSSLFFFMQKFSTNQSFSSLLPLSLLHFHICIFLTPPVTRTPLWTSCFVCPFLSLLYLKRSVRQTLTSSASLTALQRLLCILQQYCHDHLFSLLHTECWISTKRSYDKFL